MRSRSQPLTCHLSYLNSSPNLVFKWLQEVYRS